MSSPISIISICYTENYQQLSIGQSTYLAILTVRISATLIFIQSKFKCTNIHPTPVLRYPPHPPTEPSILEYLEDKMIRWLHDPYNLCLRWVREYLQYTC